MKKFIYSIAGAFLLGFTSCDSLDLAPEDYAAAGSYWQNEAQVGTFMNGLHSQLRDSYTWMLDLGELRGGTMKEGTSSIGTSLNNSSVIRNDIRTTNTHDNWCGYYGRILQVNHFIDEVTNACAFLNDSQRNAYLAQAYGLRAYYYFVLYRMYGGVPLELDMKVMGGSIDLESLYKEQSSAEQVLTAIKNDIKSSEDAFAASNSKFDKYMWSKYATLFLKAEVYLWSVKVKTNDYKEAHLPTGEADLKIAEAALNSIISSNQFELFDNYEDNFDYATKKSNKESILTMYFDRNEKTHDGLNYVYTPSLVVGTWYTPEGEKMTDVLQLGTSGIVRYEWKESFIKSFDMEDSRRAATFLEYYRGPGQSSDYGSSMLKRLGHIDSGTRYMDNDIVMMRYADVLLMMAEVENGLSGTCATWINKIRERAYGDNWSDAYKYTDGDYAANELAILKERDKEFVSEGKRWYDVIRMHDANKEPLVFSAAAAYPTEMDEDALPILNKATEVHKLLWAVHVKVLNGDPKLKQTWGYNEAEGIQ